MSIIARLGVILGINTAEFNKGLDDATKKTKEFERNQKQALKNAQQAQDEFMATAAKGLAGVAAAGYLVGQAFKYADEIEDTAAAFDVTTQSLLALKAAMQGAGGDSENITNALQKLAVSQQGAKDGSDELREAFGKLGISGKDVEKLNLQDLFKRVAQELGKVEDATQRNALAQEILGKAVKGTDWKTFVDKYKEMGDPNLLAAIKENAKAWENIEVAFKNILLFAQKLVAPLAVIVNSIADIASTMDHLKQGGSTEFDWGASMGGMPGEAITHGYGAPPKDKNAPPKIIAPRSQEGGYSTLSAKDKSAAKKAEDEAKRIKEARDALQLEIKLIKEKADIADKMFAVNSKGILLGDKAIAQEKLMLDLANDLADIRNAAAKERSKEKAQIDLINEKEKTAIDARLRQFANANSLRQKGVQREFELTMQTLDIEEQKTKEIAEVEFNSQMDLLELEKQRFEIGESGYEKIKLVLDGQDKLQKLSLSYKQNLEAINTEFDRSAKSAEDLAIKQKKTNAENLAYLQAKERIEKQAEIAQEVLAIKQERDHDIAIKNIKNQSEARLFAINTEASNTKESLEFERQKYELGYQAYSLKKIDLETGQQIDRVLDETQIKLKEINNEYELTGKSLKDQELRKLNIDNLLKEEKATLEAITKNQELRAINLKEQFELENKLFMLDLAQQKGRDIANIQSTLKVEKERLELESNRYLMSTNHYNLSNLMLENIHRLTEAEKKYNDQMKEAEYEMQRQGGGQEAREKYEKRIKNIEEIRDIELEAIRQINDARQNNLVEEIQRQKSFTEGWEYAARRFQEDAENAFNRGASAFQSVMSSMDAAISNFVETGKFKFEDFALGIIRDLLRMEMQAQASMLFQSMVSFFSPAPAPFGGYTNVGVGFGKKASGGYIDAPTIVGENGAELFVPNTPGTIIPNGSWQQAAANMGNSGFTNNGTYIANMSAIDTQSATQFLASNKNTIWAAYQSANRSVPISR